MAKRPAKTTKADGSDPYSAQRFIKGRKSHHGAAIQQTLHDKPWMLPLWAIVILGMFVFAVLISFIN